VPVGHDTRAFESSNWGDAQREISKVLPSPSASLARSESPALARAEVGIHGRQFFLKTHVTGTLLPPRPPGRRASRPRAANPSPQCGPPPQAPVSGPCGRRPRADLGEDPGAPGSGTTRISEKRGECPSPPPHPGEGQNRGNCELLRGPACSCIQPPRSVSPRQLASSPARQLASSPNRHR
jgi:hypothetical protein